MIETERNKNNKAEGEWVVWLLILAPLAIMLGKLPAMPTSDLFNSAFSLASVPRHMQAHLEDIIFVPLGALVVTFVRLTLGLRVFGVFRPILIAIAFKIIGITIGLIFLTCVLVVISFAVRPILKARRMPYFARVSVLLSSVVILMIILILAGLWSGSGWPVLIAFFSILPVSRHTACPYSGELREGAQRCGAGDSGPAMRDDCHSRGGNYATGESYRWLAPAVALSGGTGAPNRLYRAGRRTPQLPSVREAVDQSGEILTKLRSWED